MMPKTTTIQNEDGSTVTVVKNSDGDTVATTQQPQALVIRSHHGTDAGAAFFMGMIMGAFILWLLQREGRRRRHRPDAQVAAGVHDVSRDEVAALARRTATLEQIVTDPAARTAREIDALR